jgi:CheY-like chemotaxis protein
MSIESAVGQGTSVKIRLPLFLQPDSSFDSMVDSPGAAVLKILLVDDDQDIRFLVARMLKSKGHLVETCVGGREALDHLAEHELPDLVIMDQNMPGMDGIRTLAKLRESYPDLPVLISSGQPDIQEWECFRSPHVGILSKPFDMEELAKKLRELRS